MKAIREAISELRDFWRDPSRPALLFFYGLCLAWVLLAWAMVSAVSWLWGRL